MLSRSFLTWEHWPKLASVPHLICTSAKLDWLHWAKELDIWMCWIGFLQTCNPSAKRKLCPNLKSKTSQGQSDEICSFWMSCHAIERGRGRSHARAQSAGVFLPAAGCLPGSITCFLDGLSSGIESCCHASTVSWGLSTCCQLLASAYLLAWQHNLFFGSANENLAFFASTPLHILQFSAHWIQYLHLYISETKF